MTFNSRWTIPALVVCIVAASTATTIADVASVYQVVYVFKPLATSLLIVLALVQPTAPSVRYRRAVAVGLVFSLGGDVLLMLPLNLFVYGLASFLVAHVFYLIAFTSDVRFGRRWTPFVVVACVAFAVLSALWPRLPPALEIPVACYVLLLGSMAAQAVARGLALGTRPAALAATGAVLFLASDAMLSIARFHTAFYGARAWVLGTYFLAQILIALSVASDDGE